MRWVELSTTTDSYSVEKVALVLGCFGHGGSVVEERQPENSTEKSFVVKVYVPFERSYEKTRRDIEDTLSTLSGFAPIRLREQLYEPKDWLEYLKKHFGEMEIGEKFIIKPTWIHRPSPAGTRIIIELDPGEAFGTGLHSTTRLCLLALERYLKPGMSVLDLGTGSGILAIAAVKLGAAEVLALDIDPVAVKSARDNAVINSVYGKIIIKRGTLSMRLPKENRQTFDLALANITASTISRFSRSFTRVLKPGGRLVVSGIHPQGLDEVLINLALAGFTLEAINQENEWYGVIAVNN
jgi:ribosomal protein L11 methyltransferase